jgi:hypothetical protein
LANALGISTRAVSRNVAELAAGGHLDVVISRGRHKPNVYRPILKNLTQASGIGPEIPDTTVTFSAPKTGRAWQENQTRVAEKPDARDKKTGRQRPTELSNELSKELSRELSNADARESDRPNGIGDGDRCGKKSRARHANGDQGVAEGFDEFYRVYPRHVARGHAEKAYRRIIGNGDATPAELINGAMRYAAERMGEPERYTKHPTTWLNGQCWKDAPAASAARPRTNAERLMEQCGLLARGSDDEEIDNE